MAQKKSNTTQSTLPKKVGMLVYYNHELRQDIKKEVIIYKKLNYGSLYRWFMYKIDNNIDYFDFNYSIFTGGSTIRYDLLYNRKKLCMSYQMLFKWFSQNHQKTSIYYKRNITRIILG